MRVRWGPLLAGLVPVAVIVAADVTGVGPIPVTAVVVGPILAAATASLPTVATVSVAALAVAAIMGSRQGEWGTDDLTSRLLVVAVTGLAAMFVARDREARRREAAQAKSLTDLALRLQLSLEAGGMGTWIYEADSGRTTWDDRLAVMHGFAPGGYDGRFESWVQRVHPEDRDLVLSASNDAMAHGSPYAVVYRAVWPDGQVRWLEARGEALLEAGAVTGTAGVVVDVTERMTVASALEASRAEARAALHERNALGATLQAGLLPRPPSKLSGIHISHTYRPGSRHLLVGGDFFDAVEVDGTVRFVIGDVSGHGAASAAVGVSLRAAWRSAALASPAPTGWLAILERQLTTESDDAECFATVCTGAVRDNEISLMLAGHPPPVLIDATGARLVEAPAGPPVGVGAQSCCITLDVSPPWTLFLYTDGLVKAWPLPAPASATASNGSLPGSRS